MERVTIERNGYKVTFEADGEGWELTAAQTIERFVRPAMLGLTYEEELLEKVLGPDNEEGF